MGALAAERAVIVLIGAALIFSGTGFAGYAIMLALLPKLGAIGAAAASAGILLIVPLGYLLIAAWRAPPAPKSADVQESVIDTVVLTTLAGVARDKPLLAVMGAGLVGAAGMLLRRRS